MGAILFQSTIDPKGSLKRHDRKNFCTTSWVFRIGARAQKGIVVKLIQGCCYPVTVPDPADSVLKEYDINQKVVQLVQGDSQPTLVWIQGQLVAEALGCLHKVPADTALEQAAGKRSEDLAGILKCGLQLSSLPCPLPCCLCSRR